MILVGTVHIDIDGPKRLEYLLKRLQPKTITVEYPSSFTPEEVEERLGRMHRVALECIDKLERPDFEKAYFREIYSNYWYEAITPITYARQSGSVVKGVDHPMTEGGFSEDYLKQTFDLIRATTKPNKSVDYDYFRELAVNYIDEAYRSFEILAEMSQDIPSTLEVPGFMISSDPAEERESHMTENVFRAQPDVHVGGMLHVFEYPGFEHLVTPMHTRLGNAVTQRIRLCDAFRY